jgi:hypothetical protein
MMARILMILLHAVTHTAVAEKIADMDQGVEFTKCFKLEDWHSKTADDDLELADRDSNGCCPAGYTPGVDLEAQYMGAQVVCGVDADGTPSGSTKAGSSSDTRTCDYKKCFVMKIADKIVCQDGAVALLNGCCGATKGSRTFHEDCSSYDKTQWSYTSYPESGNAYVTAEFCTTYHKNYGSMEWAGDNTDADVVDGKFQVESFYAWAPCAAGGGGGGGGSESEQDASAAFSVQAIGLLTFALLSLPYFR